MKKLIIIIAVFLLALTAIIFYFRNNTTTPTLKANDELNNLTELGEPDLGFSFKLTKDFKVEENGEFSRLYAKKKETENTASTNFIYVSVVHFGKEVTDGEIYNYNRTEFEALDKLNIGESVILNASANAETAAYFKYTRIEDLMLGGYGAKAYKNEKPWEFPQGTAEYRFTIPFTQAKYIIGAYIGPDTTPGGITKSELDNLLSGLKLTPDSLKTEFTKVTNIDEWKEFSNAQPFIKFTYPSDWNQLTESQNFPEGDIFAINAVGQTQRPQTELYDGAMFAVMKPILSGDDLKKWVTERYNSSSNGNPELPENKPEYTNITIGGKSYEKIIVCGLGCFNYYHTAQNGYLYGFVTNAVGPNEMMYNQIISKIISGINYNP